MCLTEVKVQLFRGAKNAEKTFCDNTLCCMGGLCAAVRYGWDSAGCRIPRYLAGPFCLRW